MSLRSSFTKLVGSLSSRRLALRACWAGIAGIAGVMVVSATGCNNSGSLQCDSNGQNCKICDAYGCRPANSGTGGGGTGGGVSGTGGTNGTGGSTTGTSSTSSSTSSSTGGTGGSSVNTLACDSTKPCPSPQTCLADGYCHYPCTSTLDCKHYDNRFTACVSGYCE
jgi:hypothetical protein